MGSSVTYRMQFSHIASETSQGTGPLWPPSLFPDRPWSVVRCGRRCSASLSNSMVNATSAWDSRADRNRGPGSGSGAAGVADTPEARRCDLGVSGGADVRGAAAARSRPAESRRSRPAPASCLSVCQPVRASRASVSAAESADLAGSPRAASAAWNLARPASPSDADSDTLMARPLPGAATSRNCSRTLSRTAGSR